MSTDWQGIEAELRALLGDLDGVGFDVERVARFSAEIAAGVLGPERNRLSEAPQPLCAGQMAGLDRLTEGDRERLADRGRAALAAGRIAVAVLNGGMATRFGGAVKGVVEAVGGRSFLEIKRAQAQASGAALLVMNSFATHRPTLEFLAADGLDDGVEAFLQSVSIRLQPSGAVFRDRQGRLSPYAPGHGDFPDALRDSGALERLEQRGVEAVMLSNVDNLGADPDPVVIGHHLESGRDLTCEIAPAIAGDAGGAPARVGDRVEIVEGFRFPLGYDFSRQAYIATNTFLLSVPLLRASHALTWFYVEKTVEGAPVVQMERLVNELSARVATSYLAVPRDGERGRFFPVKTLEDLAALRDDPWLRERCGRC